MLTKLLVVLLAVAGVVTAARLVLHRKYRRLFDDQHLFSELPKVLASQKTAAFAQTGLPIESPRDPRVGLTTAGLSIVYSVEELDAGVLNHISLSYQGGPIALSFGARCGFFILAFLGADPGRAVVAHSRNGVTHVAFLLDPAEVRDFRDRPLAIPTSDRIEKLKSSAEAWRDSLLVDHRLLRDETELLPRLVGAT